MTETETKSESESSNVQKDQTELARARAKTREGIVVSNKMDKTAVVSVARRVRHGKYMKTVVRDKHYMVHDENNECSPGDRVVIAETRPLSRLKRWRLARIVEKAVQITVALKDVEGVPS